MDWLTQAAVTDTSSSRLTLANPSDLVAVAIPGKSAIPTVTSDAAGAGAAGASDGLGWLTAATEGTKPRRSSVKAAPKAAVAPAAAGGWLTAGKLGVLTEDGNDDNINGGGGGGRGNAAETSATRKIKEGKVSIPAAAPTPDGPGGWLTSGTLGVPVDDEIDQDIGGGDDGDSGRPTMVSGETQTEDDIEGVVKKELAPKLPPWVKRWTPPPEVEVASTPAPATGEGSEKEVSVFGRTVNDDGVSGVFNPQVCWELKASLLEIISCVR